jgi:hypothetical protein
MGGYPRWSAGQGYFRGEGKRRIHRWKLERREIIYDKRVFREIETDDISARENYRLSIEWGQVLDE